MLVRDVMTVDGLLAMLGQATPEMQALRAQLTWDGRFPTRRTWERRLNALPARIACLGTFLVEQLQPWTDSGAAVWIPLTAELTQANAADNETAPRLLTALPQTVRFVLGDTAYRNPALHDQCASADRFLVATHRGRYPHPDDGLAVRRVFHKLRSLAIKSFNEQFRGIFDVHSSVPTRGLIRTQRFALGAVFVYQPTLLSRSDHHQALRVGLKAFLKAA